MLSNDIQTALMQALALDEVYVSHKGNHFQIVAVGRLFEGISRVKQQQMIYKPLMPFFTAAQIHAVTIKAFTPQLWQRVRKLHVL